MSSRCAAVTALLVLIACDNPAAPRARSLRVPGVNRDAGTVLIKSNVVFDAGGGSFETCNGDVVTLQGKAHQVFTEIESGTATADTLYFAVHTNVDDLKGYGVPSGTRYHVNNAETEKAVITVGTEFTSYDTIHMSLELVSEGSAPNLIWDLTEVTRIDNNGETVTVTDLKNSLRCEG